MPAASEHSRVGRSLRIIVPVGPGSFYLLSTVLAAAGDGRRQPCLSGLFLETCLPSASSCCPAAFPRALRGHLLQRRSREVDFSARSTGCSEADPRAARGGWKTSLIAPRKRWGAGNLFTDTLGFPACKWAGLCSLGCAVATQQPAAKGPIRRRLSSTGTRFADERTQLLFLKQPRRQVACGKPPVLRRKQPLGWCGEQQAAQPPFFFSLLPAEAL